MEQNGRKSELAVLNIIGSDSPVVQGLAVSETIEARDIIAASKNTEVRPVDEAQIATEDLAQRKRSVAEATRDLCALKLPRQGNSRSIAVREDEVLKINLRYENLQLQNEKFCTSILRAASGSIFLGSLFIL